MAKEPDFEIAVERETPVEWKQLVHGGQFMDRILPSPIHDKLTSDTWGADCVRPRDIQNGIEDPAWSYWGGKSVLGDDGKYHWFGCRWPEDNPKGHDGWPESEIVRAIGDSPLGPFICKDVLGPGHFPEITQLSDGSWRLYHFHGYYHSESLDGPWRHVGKDEDGFPGVQMGSVCVREDGSLLMISRASRMFVKENGSDTWEKKTEEKVNPTHMFGLYEDPVIWRTEVQYHMIVNDWQGRLAYHQRSGDGINWKCDPGLAYSAGVDRYEDGTKVDWFKYERPKVFQDEYGRPTHLYLAVIDVPKWQDEGYKHSSKNIVLPLVVERRLRVLNSDPITEDTPEIRVKVLAEDGFNPHEDMNLESLRFGAPAEVDYGRGSVLITTEADDADLVLIFDGKGNGITAEEFAGKLLGKHAADGLLVGWTKLR